jgi:hypothetical protein
MQSYYFRKAVEDLVIGSSLDHQKKLAKKVASDIKTVNDLSEFLHRMVAFQPEAFRSYGDPMEFVVGQLRVLNIIYKMEYQYINSGRNTIMVSDDMYKIINSVNLDRVSVESLRHPFGAVRWQGTPGSLFLSRYAKGGIFTSISSRFWPVQRDTPDQVKVVCQDGDTPYMHLGAVHLNTDFGAVSTKVEDLKADILSGALPTDPLAVDFSDQAQGLMSFVLKACAFLSAYPSCLAKADFNIRGTTWVKVKSKNSNRVRTGGDSLFVMEPPDAYKSGVGAHFVVPHLRSLDHPRFSREDKNGSILKPGEPGFIRIVPVKGHARGGKFHYLYKDQIETEHVNA